MSQRKTRGTRELGAGWRSRAAIIMALDVVCVAASFFVALLLRFDFVWSLIPQGLLDGYRTLVVPTICVVVVTLWALRLYHSIWSFASVSELGRLIVAWAIDAAALPLIALAMGVRMPVSYWLAGCFLCFASTTGVRFSWRLMRLLRSPFVRDEGAKRVLMVGAGESGRALIREIAVSPQLGMRVVCAVFRNEAEDASRHFQMAHIA